MAAPMTPTQTTDVAERPIIFSGELIRALLAGNKTQTRRVVKPQPPHAEWTRVYEYASVRGLTQEIGHGYWIKPCPYGRVGDRLWVRERALFWCGGAGGDGSVVYAEDPEIAGLMRDQAVIDRNRQGKPEAYDGIGNWEWRSPIYMPRWASRLTLEITDVRVQRVQEISEADAEAEGVERDTSSCDHKRRTCKDVGCMGQTFASTFCEKWDTLNAKRGYSWDSNPFVWALTFEVVKPELANA